jgi:hypothetical protein
VIIHPFVAAKVPDVAEPRIDAHSDLEGALDPAIAPSGIHLDQFGLHFQRHAQARSGIFLDPLVCGSPKKTRIASPMNLSIVAPCSRAIFDI